MEKVSNIEMRSENGYFVVRYKGKEIKAMDYNVQTLDDFDGQENNIIIGYILNNPIEFKWDNEINDFIIN